MFSVGFCFKLQPSVPALSLLNYKTEWTIKQNKLFLPSKQNNLNLFKLVCHSHPDLLNHTGFISGLISYSLIFLPWCHFIFILYIICILLYIYNKNTNIYFAKAYSQALWWAFKISLSLYNILWSCIFVGKVWFQTAGRRSMSSSGPC